MNDDFPYDVAPITFQPKRLLKLADLLEADADNPEGIKFNMGTWGQAEEGTKLALSCGTEACAMGVAALSKAFHKQGLRYKTTKIIEYDRRGKVHHIVELEIYHVDALHDDDPILAAAHLFGISQNEANKLFMPSGDSPNKGKRAEKKVASKIRAFVTSKLNESDQKA